MGCDIHLRVEYTAPAEVYRLVDGEVITGESPPLTVALVDGEVKVVESEDGVVLETQWVPAEPLTPKADVDFNSYYVKNLHDPDVKAEWDQMPDLEIAYEDRFYKGRNYRLFGLLAGVRHDGICVFEEGGRGFPEDASDHVRQDFEAWGPDAHSESWQTLAEIEEHDWDTLLGEDGYQDLGFLDTISRMHDIAMDRCGGDQTAVRIVYWFDN